jgi:hypothetical protein
MVSLRRSEYQVACGQAAHGVLSILGHLRFATVSITSSSTPVTLSWSALADDAYDETDSISFRAVLGCQIRAFMAGPLAERIFHSGCEANLPSDKTTLFHPPDLDWIMDRIGAFVHCHKADESRMDRFRELVEQTWRELSEPFCWNLVRRIAAKLTVCTILTYEEVVGIYDDYHATSGGPADAAWNPAVYCPRNSLTTVSR